MTDFKQLKVWQKAHELTLEIYRATTTFPRSELYGLVSQMRRCAVSIGSNIAEGRGRDGDPDFQRFLGMSVGSAAELEYQLLLSRDLGFLSEDHYNPLHTRVAESAGCSSHYGIRCAQPLLEDDPVPGPGAKG